MSSGLVQISQSSVAPPLSRLPQNKTLPSSSKVAGDCSEARQEKQAIQIQSLQKHCKALTRQGRIVTTFTTRDQIKLVVWFCETRCVVPSANPVNGGASLSSLPILYRRTRLVTAPLRNEPTDRDNCTVEVRPKRHGGPLGPKAVGVEHFKNRVVSLDSRVCDTPRDHCKTTDDNH